MLFVYLVNVYLVTVRHVWCRTLSSQYLQRAARVCCSGVLTAPRSRAATSRSATNAISFFFCKERLVKSEMLSFHNNVYTALHMRTCARGRCGVRCGARGSGVTAARAHNATLRFVSRVTLHLFTFHVARNRLRQFFIQFPLGRLEGRGGSRGGARGVFYRSPRPATRLHTSSSLLPLLRAPALHRTRPRVPHSAHSETSLATRHSGNL